MVQSTQRISKAKMMICFKSLGIISPKKWFTTSCTLCKAGPNLLLYTPDLGSSMCNAQQLLISRSFSVKYLDIFQD
jgi:hypothetical protein